MMKEKQDLRIVFMGTPDFAVASLDAILREGYQVAGVVTAPDKPAGRGKQLSESAVKKYAVEKGLRVLQPENLKDESFLSALRDLNADLQVVVAFRMLPEAVWSMPPMGTFNLHASLLPQYRGAAPINWAIINGEKRTGVTTFLLDKNIDTGNILLRRETGILPHDTAGSLHDRLMNSGKELVVETIEILRSEKYKTISQRRKTGLNDAPKLNKENCRIDWRKPVEKVYNLIRGLSPYPGAYTLMEKDGRQMIFKIYGSMPTDLSSQTRCGEIFVEENNMYVNCSDFKLRITEIQAENKKRMPVEDFLNGFRYEGEEFFLSPDASPEKEERA